MDASPAASARSAMQTDTPAFAQYLEARRTRAEEWFTYRVSRIEACNVPVPIR